jgi:hypothetical protein
MNTVNIQVDCCHECPFMYLNETSGEYQCMAFSEIMEATEFMNFDITISDEEARTIPDKCPLKNTTFNISL